MQQMMALAVNWTRKCDFASLCEKFVAVRKLDGKFVTAIMKQISVCLTGSVSPFISFDKLDSGLLLSILLYMCDLYEQMRILLPNTTSATVPSAMRQPQVASCHIVQEDIRPKTTAFPLAGTALVSSKGISYYKTFLFTTMLYVIHSILVIHIL
jgi:hypothetical protein